MGTELRQPVGIGARRPRGTASIRIHDRYRICFVWDGTNFQDIEIVDYH